jgi:hypothetical protein
LSGSVGSAVSPVTIGVYAAVQVDLPPNPTAEFFLSEVNQANSTLVPIENGDFMLFVDVQGTDTTGYPVGIYPNVQGQLEGPFHIAGDFYLHLLAKCGGMSPQRSIPIPIRVLPGVAPMVFSSFSSNYTVVTSSTVFPLSWGYSGSGDIYIQKDNEARRKVNPGELSATFTGLSANAIFTLSGVNAMGTSWATPVLVRFSGTGVVSKLPSSPTVAIIDAQNNLEVTWTPPAIGGVYTAYKSWDITLFDAMNNAIPVVKADGTPITGFENGDPTVPDLRRFRLAGVPTGDLKMSMQAFSTDTTTIQDSDPWDTNKAFPTLPAGSVLINNEVQAAPALKGETVTISIKPTIVADRWRAVFGDQSTTDWLPLSSSSILKSFMVGGDTQVITIEVEKDYSTALPPVKLRRSLTTSIFIVDEDFIPVESTDPILGDIGVGGDAGFEVTDGTNVAYAPANYAAFTKAVVKDEATQELKLMLGVARGRDGSSVLGTMAIDVFPLPGRPYAKDLIKPTLGYLVDDGQNASAIKITTDGLPPVTVGHSLTWTKPLNPGEQGNPGTGEIKIQAVGGKPPYTWAAENLPPGVRFTADGTLSGTVLAPGTYPIDISVADASTPPYIDMKTLSLVARSDLEITTPRLPGPTAPGTDIPLLQVGVYYEGQLEATGGVKTYSWKQVSGNLPNGLTIDALGKVSGYPTTMNSTTDFSTDFVVVVQVTDSLGAKSSKSYTVRLTPQALTVGDPDQTVLFAGERFIVRIPVSGGDFTVGPDGVSSHVVVVAAGSLFDSGSPVINGFIELSFNPSTAPTPNAVCHITVTDGKTTVAKDYVFTVRPALAPFTGLSLAGFPSNFQSALPVGQTVQSQTIPFNLEAGTYTIKDNGPLPTYINGLTGYMHPVAGSQGGFTVSGLATSPQTLEVSASATLLKAGADMGMYSRTYSIIAQKGAMTPADPADFQVTSLPSVVGSPFYMDPMRSYFNATATTRGNLTAKVKQGFSLPLGVSLDARNGLLYGTLRAKDVTSTAIEFYDAQVNLVATSEVTFDFYTTDLSLSDTLAPLVMQGKYLVPMTIGGSPNPAAFVVKGAFPDGLGMSVTGDVLTLSGRPTEGGYFDIWIRLTDGSNANRVGLAYRRLEVRFNEPLQILTTTPPSITLGQAYSYQLQATGGIPFTTGSAYKWAVIGTTQLPTPYTLSEDGLITGTSTPSTPSNWSGVIQVQVTDASDSTKTATMPMAITPLPPLVITTTSLPSGVALSPYADNVYLAATGGLPPATEWAVIPDGTTPGALPTGMTLDATTGLLSGTPGAPFNGSLRFSVKDSANPKNQSFKVIPLNIVPIDAFHIESVAPLKPGVANALPDAFVGVAYGPIEVYVKGGTQPYTNPRILSAYTTSGTETPFPTSVNLEIVPKPGTVDRYLIRSKAGTTPSVAYSGSMFIVVDDVHSVEPPATRPYQAASAIYSLYVDRYAPQGDIACFPSAVKQGAVLTISGSYAIGGGTDTVTAKFKVVRKDTGAIVYAETSLPPTSSSTPLPFSRTDLNTAIIPPGTVVVATLTLTNASGMTVTKTAEATISSLSASLSASPATINNNGVTFSSTTLTPNWDAGNFTATLVDLANDTVPLATNLVRNTPITQTPHSTTNYAIYIYDANNVKVATASCTVTVAYAPTTGSISPTSQAITAGSSFTATPSFSGGLGRLKAVYGGTTLYDAAVTSGTGVSIPSSGVPQAGVINLTLTVTSNGPGTTPQTATATATVSAASVSLTANPTTVIKGGSPSTTTLTFSWSGGSSAKILRLDGGTWVDLATGLAASGTKTDTPLHTPTTSYRLEVYDAGNEALNHSDVSVTVNVPPDPDPIINTLSIPAAQYGVFYSTTLSGSSGVAPLSWQLVSPSASVLTGYGLSFDVNGTLSGTPNATCPTSLAITVKLTDNSATNTDPQKTYTLATTCQTSLSLPGTINLTNGVAFDLNRYLSNKNGSIVWGMSPAITGVTLTTAGILTANLGSLNQAVTFTVTGTCPGFSGTTTLVITAKPVNVSWTSTAITVTTGDNFTIHADASGGDGGNFTWAISSQADHTWPAFVPSPVASGVKSIDLSCKAPSTPGTYYCKVQATDASGNVGHSEDCVITVAAPLLDFFSALQPDSNYLGVLYGSVSNTTGLGPGYYVNQGNAWKITTTNTPADAVMSVSSAPPAYMGTFSVVKLTSGANPTFEVRSTPSSMPQTGSPSTNQIGLTLSGTGGSKTKSLSFMAVNDNNIYWAPFQLTVLNESGTAIALPLI